MTQDAKKQQIVENVWLHYYNQELYRRSVITELERNKMALKIENRKPPSVTKNRREREMER